MPRGDGTGPAGVGSMTGRAAGFCAGTGIPGYANPVRGYGFGPGYGRGGGFGRGNFGGRHRHFASVIPVWMRAGGWWTADQKPDPEFEKRVLSNQAQALQSELDAIRTRLAEIDK
jgi:hypothetical protein